MNGEGASLARRMWRAAKLESRLYAEVAFDPGANRQAMAVVAMTSLLIGLLSGAGAAWRGTYLGYKTDPEWLLFPVTFLISLALGLAMWLLVSLFAWWLGARVFWKKGPQFTRGAVLRATGFARVTGILYFLTYIPLTGTIFTLVLEPVFPVASVAALPAVNAAGPPY